MQGSDRGIIATLIGCLILAGVALNSARDRERDARAPTEHSKRVEQIETDRAGLPLVAESFASNPEPQNTDEREKRDLAAQEASAVWGFWVAIFAIAQTIATFVGLYYVKRTLDATLKAVKDTSDATILMRESNEIAKKAQHPNFGIQFGHLKIEWLNRLEISYRCFNSSISVAQDVQIVFTIHFYAIPASETADRIAAGTEMTMPFAAIHQAVEFLGTLSERKEHDGTVKSEIHHLSATGPNWSGMCQVRCIAQISGLYRGEEIKDEFRANYYIGEDMAALPFRPFGLFRSSEGTP